MKIKEKIDKLILGLSNEETIEDAEEYFETVRYIKFKKTPKLHEIICRHQLAILFKLKEQEEKEEK